MIINVMMTDFQLDMAMLVVETYLETLVDQRHHAEDRAAVEARGDDTSEYDEMDVCIDEATVLLMLLQNAQS